MKSIILAEKPSVAREIARVLGCTNSKKSFIEGPKYIVTWALGHLIELQTPEDYDNRYKQWRMEDLPIMPREMKLKVIRKTSAQYRTFTELAKRKDVNELIIATDAGREGELVARWIMKKARWNKPFKRLWISSQTDKAIREGFKNLKPGHHYDCLYESAVCRAEADWLIGLNVSRALTTKFEESLSAGRVQTPTLSMLINREKQIASFKPSEYWVLNADHGSFTSSWQKGSEKRLFNHDEAKQILQKTIGKVGIIRSITKKVHVEHAPLPYDLNELQRDANKRYGFSAKKTLSTLQNLYEHYKLVTYPRTDSRYLTSDMVSTMKDRIVGVKSGYQSEVKPLLSGKLTLPARVVNDQKVSDHHAIIVTEQPLNLSKLSSDEFKLYDLIAKKFIALFYPPHKYEVIKMEIDVNGETFVATEKQIIDIGFKQIYQEEAKERKNTSLNLNKGDKIKINDIMMKSAFTEPPERLNEADLLGAMERHGLGTPATRADIIEKLIKSESIERTNNRLIPTKKGKQLINLVAEQLRSPEMTAKWEQELEAISKGKGNAKQFLENIREQTKKLVQEIKTSEQTYRPHNLTGSKCPECGNLLREKNTKQGRILVCSSRECHYKRAKDPKLSNRRCPQCHKKMEIHSGKAGTYFQCRFCQIVEKAEDKKKKISKHEEKKLLKKYSDNDSFGASLGDALMQALKQKKSDE